MREIASRLGILGEFGKFLWKRKLFWLIPMMVVLAIFALLIVLGSNPVTSPFVYSLF